MLILVVVLTSVFIAVAAVYVIVLSKVVNYLLTNRLVNLRSHATF